MRRRRRRSAPRCAPCLRPARPPCAPLPRSRRRPSAMPRQAFRTFAGGSRPPGAWRAATSSPRNLFYVRKALCRSRFTECRPGLNPRTRPPRLSPPRPSPRLVSPSPCASFLRPPCQPFPGLPRPPPEPPPLSLSLSVFPVAARSKVFRAPRKKKPLIFTGLALFGSF